MMTDISRTTINLTNIDKLIKDVVNSGGDKDLIINKLSTLPQSTLIKSIQQKNNAYYCKLALSEQDRKGDGVLVDLPKGAALKEKLRKKSNFAYQRAVYKNKRNNDRTTKTKNFLSELNKKK
jgi:hypothetical protein